MKVRTYVIDNDPVLLFIMNKLMIRTQFNANVSFYENGNEALDNLRQEYNSQDLFVIFLDINMPELSGWEFLDELDLFTKADNMLVYMISSSINRSDMEKANAHKRVSRFFVKPIEEDVLSELKVQIDKKANC